MRNPKWHRDEIILALDLYYSLESGEMSANNININSVPERTNITYNKMPPTAFITQEVRSPGEGLKAVATSAAKLGAATAKLLTIKKKAGPTQDK